MQLSVRLLAQLHFKLLPSVMLRPQTYDLGSLLETMVKTQMQTSVGALPGNPPQSMIYAVKVVGDGLDPELLLKPAFTSHRDKQRERCLL